LEQELQPHLALLRSFSSSPEVAASSKSESSKQGGPGLIHRLLSFLVGAGATALVTQFYIFSEIRAGNSAMLAKQLELEKRVQKLEGKK
jgi:hypothetical protein